MLIYRIFGKSFLLENQQLKYGGAVVEIQTIKDVKDLIDRSLILESLAPTKEAATLIQLLRRELMEHETE